MIGYRLTTDQFHRGLQSCAACSVNGWPAVVEWAKEIPRAKSGKPYAILRWTEYPDVGTPRPIFCNLKKAEINRLEILDCFTVQVVFNTGEEAITVKLLLLSHLMNLCPPVKFCNIWKSMSLPSGLTVENCNINRLQSVN